MAVVKASQRAHSVLIADDHPPTRAGVRDALEQSGFVVCAEVGTAPAAVEAARSLRPDICLLDLHMPGGGVNAAHQITSELADTVVVMLTVAQEDEHLFAALRAGAAGYLLKDIAPERLGDALRAVLRGEAAIPRTLVARLVEEFQGRGIRRLALSGRRSVRLSSREWEVLQALREGLSTKDAAERLGIAPVTVRTHVSAILHKLRVKDRAAAVRLLEEEDWR
jgi:DNA-binding NarL/FixJ family response regulator